jgi:Flp pilus assembly protein TadB
MILGALAISSAVATAREHSSTNQALERECDRYHLDYQRVLRAYAGSELPQAGDRRSWWDYAIVAAGCAVFVYLGVNARVPALSMNLRWVCALAGLMFVTAAACGWALWKSARFS